MKREKSTEKLTGKGRGRKILTAIPMFFLCMCLGFNALSASLANKVSADTVPEMEFGWDTGLSDKLDKYSSAYNAKRGQEYGSNTLIANADGGIPNAPLLGNGSVGGVFGGTPSGQSINLGMNDFWKGTYDPSDMSGMAPQAVGSIGYNVVSEKNTANTDIDLATAYKKVTASSEMEGCPASAAVGGDYVSNAFWGMGWWSASGQGDNSWLKLEFDEPVTFSRFALWNAGSCMLDAEYDDSTGRENWTTNAFEIQVSDDGNEWTTVYEEKDNFQPIYDRDLEAPATGRFVRLYIRKSVLKGVPVARVCKFSLFENAKNDKNLMPLYVNGAQSDIEVSSICAPGAGEDAPHIYTSSTLYATVCGTQQHLAGYGSSGYGWYTDTTPSGDYIIFKLKKPVSFKSYQLWNASASSAGAYNRGDWRGWTMETSFDGMDWTKVHEVAEPTDPSQPNWAGQPAVCSFDIPEDKLEATSSVRYIKLTIKSVFGSRGCLSQLKIFADTLAESGIDLNDDATYYQNIKEGKVGVSATYDGQAYETYSTMSQDGSNYLVTEFKNNSDKPLTMRYYTAAHQYRNPEYCHSAGVEADGNVIYATRTTPTADPSRLVWVSAATIAASVEGAKWTNPGYTNGMAYGDFTIPAGETVRVKAYIDGRQYNDSTPDYSKITAANSPTQANAVKLAQQGDAQTIFTDSAAWWKDYWLASYVDIYDEVVEQYYYTAMYIVGSATREGSVPSSLFGPFITSDSTAWGGTYVTDYNLYGTYMAVAGANRADLLKPLVMNAFESWGGIEGVGDGIGSTYGDYFNAATINKFKNSDGSLMFKNGVDGILSAVASAPRGYATNVAGFDRILFTSAYAAIPVLSYFDMTQGTGEVAPGITLTRELEYEYLKDVMQLWEQILVFENGVYKVKYDSAWEFEANNMGNAFTISCMHMFTQRLIADAEALGISENDEPRITKWKHIDANMEPYPTAMVVDKNGGNVVRECFSDTWTTALKGHVTYNGNTDGNSNPNVVVAQTIPTDQLGLYSDPAQKQLMRNSIATIKSWGNINAMPTFFSAAARVGYGSDKYGNNNKGDKFDSDATDLMSQYRKVANGGMVQNNVSNLVDPLQLIDTCGGAQGLNDMLVQSYKDIITLFPAYASNQAGRFVDLQVKGGFLVSAQQDASGEITYARISSQFGGKVILAMPEGANWEIIDGDGNVVEVVRSNVGDIVGYDAYNSVLTVEFDTQAGKDYYIRNAAQSAQSVQVKAAPVAKKEELA